MLCYVFWSQVECKIVCFIILGISVTRSIKLAKMVGAMHEGDLAFSIWSTWGLHGQLTMLHCSLCYQFRATACLFITLRFSHGVF